MSPWTLIFWSALTVGGAASLYGLHRLAISLEDRGYLYYRRRSERSAAGCFVAMERVIEPRAEHVMVVQEERQYYGTGQGGDPERPRP